MKEYRIILIIAFLIILTISVFLYAFKDYFTYVGTVDIVEVDCSKKREILDSVYHSDQRIRIQNTPINEYGRIDHRNQEMVISIIEKCGMPTLKDVSQTQMDAIFLGLQHSTYEIRKKYFPKIIKAVENGDLSKQQFALMQDRILVEEGKSQLYGTQYEHGKLFEIESLEKVNERRKEMGMRPLEEYLKDFNIEYNQK